LASAVVSLTSAYAVIGTKNPGTLPGTALAGLLAFHYCFVPGGQPLTLTRLIRAAGLRWPVEEGFRPGKDCFGLDQSQVRLYTAIARHTVLVMAALAVCAVTAACSKTAPMPSHPRRPGLASRHQPTLA
jgi:hypothetical protein